MNRRYNEAGLGGWTDLIEADRAAAAPSGSDERIVIIDLPAQVDPNRMTLDALSLRVSGRDELIPGLDIGPLDERFGVFGAGLPRNPEGVA